MRVKKILGTFLIVLLLVSVNSSIAQVVKANPGQDVVAVPESIFDGLTFRSVGPATFSGRITDLAVFEDDPAIFYAATPHGGLWKTENGGTTWEVLFSDRPDVSSIGDVTIAPTDPSVVWIGTGESTGFLCASWGNGVYKSTDGGRNWQHTGLTDTRHISRIIVDPVDNDVVFVAATGHLWGPNKERGVFKTTDGGATWAHALFIDEDTGVADLVMDPSNNQVLYAATYQYRYATWGSNLRGAGSGIYKSTDAGITWKRLTNGIPSGQLGRIGLDIYRKNPSVVYAVIQHENGRDVYRSDDSGARWRRMNETGLRLMGHEFRYYSQIRIDPNDDDRIYVFGVGVYMSDDGGRTFVTNASAVQSGFWPATTWGFLFNTRSDYRTMWIDPANSRHLMGGTDGGIFVSRDRSKTWEMIDNMDLGEYERVGFDMDTPYRVYGGMQDNRSWGGPSVVRSYLGIGNADWFMVGGGDGFWTWGDPNDSRIIYAESQYGNMSRVDRITNERKSIKPQLGPDDKLRWNWNTPIVISPHIPGTIFTAANRVFKSTDRGHSWKVISPDLTAQLDSKALSLMGVSGKDFKISGNSWDGGPNISYGSIVTFAESPKKAGLFYAGTDDGTVHVSKDDGETWINISNKFPGLPKNTYVARVVPSAFSEGTVYAAFDGHRSDDNSTYVYASIDYGETWTSIANDIPKGFTVRSLLEDLKNQNVLYLGTEFGLFVSLDKGMHWTRLKGSNLPTAPIFDMAQHPRENDLILAVHGRSIWILDDLTPIQQAAEALTTEAYLFDMRPATEFNPANDREWMAGARRFWGTNPAFGATISYYLKDPSKDIKISVRDMRGELVREMGLEDLQGANRVGINRIQWNLRHQPLPVPSSWPPEEERNKFFLPDPPRAHSFHEIRREELNPLNGPFVLPGEYQVTLGINGKDVATKSVMVLGDPLIPITDSDRRDLHNTLLALHGMQRTAYEAAGATTLLSDAVQNVLENVANPPAGIKTAAEELASRITDLRSRLVAPQSERSDFPSKIGALKTSIWGSTSLPTGAQMRNVDELGKELERVVNDANSEISGGMPQLYKALADSNLYVTPPRIKEIGTSSRSPPQ